MNRSKIAATVALLTMGAAFSAPSVMAQKPAYDQLMKSIQSTFASVGKSLDASAAPAAAADAAKLEDLFKQTETFWAQFKTKDAMDAAKTAREASAATAAAARENDLAKAKAAYASIGRTCGGCHSSHREQMPDKTFRIKP